MTLLANGVNASLERTFCRSLHFAARNDQGAIIRLLLSYAADKQWKCCWGRSPLSFAADCGDKALVLELVNNGAELEVKDYQGRTPLSFAVISGHEEVVRLLLEKGADPGSTDKSQRSQLSFAAESGNTSIMKPFLKDRTKLNLKDSSGRSPLSFAARYGHVEAVKLLLAEDADLGGQNGEWERSPMYFALKERNTVIIELLNSAKRQQGNSRSGFFLECMRVCRGMFKVQLGQVQVRIKQWVRAALTVMRIVGTPRDD